jgi:hypothetical protein
MHALYRLPGVPYFAAMYAATAPGVKGGGYYGPDKLSETRGYPAPAKVPPRAEDAAAAQRLWRESAQLTRAFFRVKRMHRFLIYAAFGWLTFSGTMHFFADVVSQHLRGARAPSAETTLYYGLHSSFALGQVVLGALGLFLARRAPGLLRTAPILAVSVTAGIAWLVIAVLFIEYWQPKANAALILALMLAVVLTGRQ